MWPFSRSSGQASQAPDPGSPALREYQSAEGGVSTAALTPVLADEPMIWSDRLTRLFRYWSGKRGGRPCPDRADIDPLDIPDLLPILFLADVEGEGTAFRFRLVGSEFVRKYGLDFTGRTLEQVNNHAYSDAIVRDYSDCAKRCMPLVSRNSFINDQGVYWKYERVLLPLGDGTGRVGMLLGGMDINLPVSELHKLDNLRRRGLSAAS